jgi:hypothetical protein
MAAFLEPAVVDQPKFLTSFPTHPLTPSLARTMEPGKRFSLVCQRMADGKQLYAFMTTRGTGPLIIPPPETCP